MGLTYAKIKLSNPRKPNLKDVDVDSLVDTGNQKEQNSEGQASS